MDEQNVPKPPRPDVQRWPLRYVGFMVLGVAILGSFAYLVATQPRSARRPVPGGPIANLSGEYPYNPQQPYPSTPPDGSETPSTTEPSVATTTAEVVAVDWLPRLVKQAANSSEYITRYLAGTVASGTYVGQNLYLEDEPGMGGSGFSHYVLRGEERVYVGRGTTTIPGISDVPEELTIPATSYKLKKRYAPSRLFSGIKVSRIVFTDPVVGKVYLSDDGCFTVELPDHTALAYDLVIPFVNVETGEASFTFTDGTRNEASYVYDRITGCGAFCYYLAIVPESQLRPTTRLTRVARTSGGEDLFEITNQNDPVLRALYEDRNTMPYYGGGEPRTTSSYSYGEFISHHPLLYWQDPLGRWVEFKNQLFIVAAEMCKPVIYLYPPKTESLTVKVKPNGGFTYSNPPYLGSWEVEASPDGQLRDLRTGERYPYLFWEGVGLNYPEQDRGWVVARSDLESFLGSQLPKLGLRGREVDDFKSYWLGRLTEKPYYRLSFLTREEFGKLAPLEIGPAKPTTVIRVMLTARGLDRYEQTVPQDLDEPPARGPFTVVEWGGVVLR